MAHLAKYARPACGHMLAHYGREKNDKGEFARYARQEIDPSRSGQNYNLAPERGCSQMAFIEKRLSEVSHSKRKDLVVMCDWVITLPQYERSDGLLGSFDRERIERTFFERAYRFMADRYGEENVISSYVHKDETTPHMHFAFVPAVEDAKKGGLKVSGKDCVNRYDLQTFHTDLEKHLDSFPDWHFEVLNEATKDGNKTVAELKMQTNKEKIDQQKLELDFLERKTKPLRELEANAAALDFPTARTLFHSDSVRIKKADLETLKEQAQAFYVWQPRVLDMGRRERAVSERERQLSAREYRADERDRELTAKAAEVSSALEHNREVYARALEQVEQNRTVFSDLQTARETIDELQEQNTLLQIDNVELQEKVSSLSERLRNAYKSLSEVVKAVSCLKYGKDDTAAYRANLTPKQGGLIEAIAEMAAGSAEADGFTAEADEMRRYMGIGSRVKEFINKLTRHQSHDDGMDR